MRPACPVTAPNWSGVGAGQATGLILLPMTEVVSDWVSMSHLLCGDGQLLRGIIEVENFARYLRGFYLRSLPEAESSAGGAASLNRPPDTRHKAVVKQG